MAEAKQVDLEDSNLAGIGSEADAAARKAAAQTEPMWEGAGAAPGVQVWRVENKRTEADTADFGVNFWPKEEYGTFYSGDSYIIMKTTENAESGKLEYDLHFWLGESTTQDESGVAAYKTVELDDLLDGAPVQYREVQNFESALFLGYFPAIKYLEGGMESGFRHVEAESYTPRLLHVRKAAGGGGTRVKQVACELASLNHGDCYVLDAGATVYLWQGDSSSPFEKMKAASVQADLVSERNGKAVKGDSDSDEFWALLGGPGDISNDDQAPQEVVEFGERVLFQLSDASGELTFTEAARGEVGRDALQSSDVFVIDVQSEIFVWVGSDASASERRNAMKSATQYLSNQGRPAQTRITRVVEGAREPINFNDVFNA